MLSERERSILAQLAAETHPIRCWEPDDPVSIADIGGITIPRGGLVAELNSEGKPVEYAGGTPSIRIFVLSDFTIVEHVEWSKEIDGRVVVSVI